MTLVEYSSSIMKHYSQKKERREKYQSLDSRTDISEDPIASEVKKLYDNIHRIKQEIKIPKQISIEKINKETKIKSCPQKVSLMSNDGPQSSSIIFKPQTGSRAESTSKILPKFTSPQGISIDHPHPASFNLSLVKSTSEQPKESKIRQQPKLVKMVKRSNQISGQQEETYDTTSLHLHSENDSSMPVEEHLHSLADSLDLLVREPSHPRKEVIYRQLLMFVTNLKRFEVDNDLVIKMKIGRFLSVIYSLLLKVNDSNNEVYSVLLVETSALIARVKHKVLTMVNESYQVFLKRQR